MVDWSNIGVVAQFSSALISAIALIIAVSAFRNQTKTTRFVIFDSNFNNILGLEKEYYSNYDSKSEAQKAKWDSLFLNAVERLCFLINKNYIDDPEMEKFYESAVIKWYEGILLKRKELSEDPKEFEEMKKLYKELKNQTEVNRTDSNNGQSSKNFSSIRKYISRARIKFSKMLETFKHKWSTKNLFFLDLFIVLSCYISLFILRSTIVFVWLFYGAIVVNALILSNPLYFLVLKVFKLKLKKGECQELKREDDVLLTGTGFLQATYFLALANFINRPMPDYLANFSIVLFLITLTFFILRGRGKICNSNKWRYYSALFTFFLLIMDLMTLSVNVWSLSLNWLNDFFGITAFTIWMYILVLIFTFTILSFKVFNPYFEARYDIKKNKGKQTRLSQFSNS